MSLAPRLDLRQSQQLVMTPQLQQAIKLLLLNNIELEAHVLAEIEANPLIEIERDDPPTAAEETPNPPEPPQDDMRTDELIARGEGLGDTPVDADYVGETFHHASDEPTTGPGTGSGAGEGGDGARDIDGIAESTLGLADHLESQAAAQLTGMNLAIALYLIDQIDDAGYLRGSLDEVAQALGVTCGRVEAIVRLIQCFDPTGVGARTLAECLTLQAREADVLDRRLRLLLKNLDVLARGDMVTLRRICGVGSEELAALVRTLRSFDPKPGMRFGGDPPTPVAPDVLVRRTSKGWGIELNQATLPRVLVNNRYHTELVRNAKGPAKTFLNECLTSANWLARALDQRARTIVTVATEIVRQQERFFEHGVRYLRPLNLRTVAVVVGMHESTISRVTSNKYLECERGLFELKFFFAPALQAVSGTVEDAVSTTSVKRHIRELIAGETADTVQSDDALVDVLRAEGFDVARRTVAKYREGLGLGSSVARRRRFAMMA
jgi:RNA polymerase sigma-54 factor